METTRECPACTKGLLVRPVGPKGCELCRGAGSIEAEAAAAWERHVEWEIDVRRGK